MPLYPVLVRDQWFGHHTYTLRVADNIEVRLTEEQVLSLREQIERDQTPISEADVAILQSELAEIRAKRTPYPPNTKCVCGDLIHPDQPFVELQADGSLFHWNADGGGHRADAEL